MQFGKVIDEPIGFYHATDCVSKTRLDTFRQNPELYRRIFVSKEVAKPEPTEAMLIGSATGAIVLEGERVFDERYVIVPEDAPRRPSTRQREALKPSKASLDAIAWWDDFNASNEGKTILTGEQQELVLVMREAIWENETFRELLGKGQPEVTFRIQGERFAVQVRPDWWNEEGCSYTDGYPYILDLKTIASLPQDDPEHLGRHIADWGYHRSAYLYPEVTANALGWKPDLPRPRFFLAFMEKEEPFHSEIVELPEFDVAVGQRQVTDDLLRLRRCVETGVWSNRKPKIRTVSLPSYYVKRALETTEPHL